MFDGRERRIVRGHTEVKQSSAGADLLFHTNDWTAHLT